ELHALNRIDLVAENDEGISATDLFLYAGVPGQGGTISLRATDGDNSELATIKASGMLVANASVDGAAFLAEPAYLYSSGGQVELLADGGLIAASNASFIATGAGNPGDPLGGLGTGGAIDLTVSNGGILSMPSVDLVATGRGGDFDTQGGDGVGGAVT